MNKSDWLVSWEWKSRPKRSAALVCQTHHFQPNEQWLLLSVITHYRMWFCTWGWVGFDQELPMRHILSWGNNPTLRSEWNHFSWAGFLSWTGEGQLTVESLIWRRQHSLMYIWMQWRAVTDFINPGGNFPGTHNCQRAVWPLSWLPGT